MDELTSSTESTRDSRCSVVTSRLCDIPVMEVVLLVDRLERVTTEPEMFVIEWLISRIAVDVRLRPSDCTAAEETPLSDSCLMVPDTSLSSCSDVCTLAIAPASRSIIELKFSASSDISVLAENFNSMMERLAGAIAKVHTSLHELRDVSGTIKQLSESGVSSAAVQSEGLKRTSTAIREINHSITNISGSVVTLSSLSTSNTTSMTGMSQSLEVTTEHLESLVLSVEEVSSSIIEMAAAVRQIEGNSAILATDTTKTAALVNEMDGAIKRIGSQAADTS